MDAALAELPDSCDSVALDVRDEAAVADLLARVGDLDHVVFTAGDQVDHHAVTELSLAQVRRAFDVRFWGADAVGKHAAPRIRPGGSITLTSGTVGVRPSPAPH